MTDTLLATDLAIEWVPIAALIPHPENYRTHPHDQLDHLAQSLREHGFYRPIVTARDLTILAGHGVWQAAKLAHLDTVPVHRRDYEPDSPEALKILVGDNTLPEMASNDDAALADLLDRIREESDAGLVGTGFTDDALRTLVETLTGDTPDSVAGRSYSDLIQSPIYEVTGERPAPSALVDASRTDALLAQIDDAAIPDDVRTFLRRGAMRHLTFDYAAIAEFYAHADAEVQSLMEQSALVIIDADQAIDLGFARLIGELRELSGEDDGE